MLKVSKVALVVSAALGSLGAGLAHAEWGPLAIADPGWGRDPVRYDPRGVEGTLVTLGNLEGAIEFYRATGDFQSYIWVICTEHDYQEIAPYGTAARPNDAYQHIWCNPADGPLVRAYGGAGSR